MSGFVNNFYYGKAGKADYTPDQLPSTRINLFLEMLRVHFSGLMGVNLMYLLFCLPAIVWTVLSFMVLMNGTPGDSVMMMYLPIMIPFLGIAGIGAPGMMYVLRNWARDQHSFVMSDFKEKIKENWKYGLITGLIGGVLLFVGYVGWIFYGFMATTNVVMVIPQMMVLMLVLFWWMMNMLIYTMMVTYDMKYMQLLKNCAIMVIARLPMSLLIFVGSLVIPLLALFLGNDYVLGGAVLVYLIIGFALTGLVYASYANSTFDRYLNPNIEGAPVNMGLRDPSLDDDDNVDDIDDPNPVG
ncbi:DUF624 domain-containing protein [Eubacteriales bacterium OttesenSCG-928-N13]|nr:DUF624 domain-containing protein [Eubacteriales bacterium OttesenSCG-928-N13]